VKAKGQLFIYTDTKIKSLFMTATSSKQSQYILSKNVTNASDKVWNALLAFAI